MSTAVSATQAHQCLKCGAEHHEEFSICDDCFLSPAAYPVGGIDFDKCEDWLIYGHDLHGVLYSVNTEMWPEWLQVDDEMPLGLELVILPIARQRWEQLDWRYAGHVSELVVQL